jgi:hypothetical protein
MDLNFQFLLSYYKIFRGRKQMKRKIMKILVCMLVIFASILPVTMALNVNKTNVDISTAPSRCSHPHVILNATSDALVYDLTPWTNYGGEFDLWVGDLNVDISRSYVQFNNVTTIPSDADIWDAKVGLYYDHSEGIDTKDISVHHISDPWDEFIISWFLQPIFDPAPEDIKGLGLYPTLDYIFWDILFSVQRWINLGLPNNGVVFKGVTETGSDSFKQFPSRESPLLFPPILKIQYNTRPDPPTIIGPTGGIPRTTYDFTFISNDPEGCNVKYFIDWGDGNSTPSGYMSDGLPGYNASHYWLTRRTYNITAYTVDWHGLISPLAHHTIIIPRNREIFISIFEQIIQRFPLLKTILGLHY